MNARSIERQVEKLLRELTVAEKVHLCHAVSKFSSGGVERLGIPCLTMSDGPHGVREEISADSWDAVGGDEDYSTYLPTGTALAATWNVERAREFGEVLGSEARERGKDVILGPGVNMVRSPLCGRNFEYYSEDPFLAGTLAASAIGGIQSQGTAACVKHFALNSQELHRHDVDARCNERTLRELYLPAFEMAVKDGHTMTIMGAYNKFRGQHCCENDYLLNEILKREWGFDGVVISDWAGVYDTHEAGRFGMDIEMGTCAPSYDEYHLATPFEKAVERGEIEPAELDDKARRILRLMFRLGILGDNARPAGERNTPAHQATAKKIALEAITLLKNRNRLLPLRPGKLEKLLVVGDNAVRKHHFGGHSSAVKALYEVTPLEGIRNYLRDYPVEVEFIRGYPVSSGAGPIPTALLGIVDAGAGTRGWRCEIYDNHDRKGDPVAVMPLENAEFDPERDLPESLRGKDFGVMIRGELTPEKTETWEFFLDGASQSWFDCSVSNIENCKSEENVCGSVKVKLEAGRTYPLTMPIHIHMNIPVYPVRLTAKIGEGGAGAGLDDALRSAAESADAILFFGGLNHTFDAEGSDRKDMALHEGQNDLISALAAINPRMAVVLVGGSPMEMPWVDEVRAIVQMWYAGMEGGNAIADILFGAVSPSGKLPFTFPKKLADSPAHALNDYAPLICNYAEGVLMGYRWFDTKKCEPLFSSGHGLSYTTFEYSDLAITELEDGFKVSVTVKNTGSMRGAETAQLYVAPPKCRFVRPVHELKGFAKCELEPGKKSRLSFKLDFRSFAYYNQEIGEWEIAPGRYRIEIGSGSRDIRLAAAIQLS